MAFGGFGKTREVVDARQTLRSKIEEVGTTVNGLREMALDNDYPFLAGILRGVEELLLMAMNRVNDVGVPDSEL